MSLPDYEWWEQHGRRVKARLTRAENSLRENPLAAMAAAKTTYAEMREHGYPDWWHRVQRLYEDGYYAARLRGIDVVHGFREEL